MLGDTAPLVADALGDLREDDLAAVLRPDARRARELIAAAVEAGAHVESLYLKVLQPALEEVGLRWERAEISVAREHLLAAGAACSALRRLPDPPLIVAGGRAFRGDEALAVTVGADAYAHDPADLLRVLAERVPV
jgi:methanogenic corrinoid protein MtbC1